jgi:hypothetical protein
VHDVLPTGRRVLLGEGLLRRKSADDDEAQLEVDVSLAQGEQLEVDILDLDSPPLDAIAIVAVLREVSLVFSCRVAMLRQAPCSSAAAACELPTTTSPRWPRSPTVRPARRASARSWRTRRSTIARSSASPCVPAPRSIRASSRTAARSAFLHRGRVWRGCGSTTADLAAAQPSLSDLRIVDGEGRQWPYLLERDAVTAAVPMQMQQAGLEARQAR